MEQIPLAILEEYLYKNYKMIDSFSSISKLRIDYLLKLVNKFKLDNLTNDCKMNYIKTVQYLNKPMCRVVKKEYLEKYNLIFSSIEELYFFLINSIDPECNILKYYLQNYNSNINKEIKDKFGFYNEKFLYIEKKYNITLLNNFIFNINKDYSKILVLLSTCNLDFKTIDNDRMNEIKELSILWNNIQTNSNTNERINSCIYNAVNQKDFLELNDEKEILMFIIFTIDSTFKLLQIHEDECNYKNIINRSKNEVGIYLKCLIDIERKILEAHNLDIELINWEKKKINKKSYTNV